MLNAVAINLGHEANLTQWLRIVFDFGLGLLVLVLVVRKAMVRHCLLHLWSTVIIMIYSFLIDLDTVEGMCPYNSNR